MHFGPDLVKNLVLADLLRLDPVLLIEPQTLCQEIRHPIWNQLPMVVLQLVLLSQHPLLDQWLRVCYKVVLLEQHVMHQQPKRPYIHFGTISLLPENLWRHEDRSAHDFFVYLFFHCETEVSQLVQQIVTLFLQENVVWFDVSVDHVVFRYELDSPSKLVHNLECLWLRKSPSLGYNLLQIAVRTELQNHGNVGFSQEAIVYFGREHSVRVFAECELPQYVDLAIWW